MNEEATRIEVVAVRRETAARMLDCSLTTIWKLSKEGKLDAIKVGADDRITVESIRRLANQQASRT